MKARIVFFGVLILLAAAAGMGMYAWKMKPELVKVTPADKAKNVPVTSPIMLEFSTTMAPSTVEERLKISPLREGAFTWQQNVLNFTPFETWPAGQEISVTLESGARAVSWLAFPMSGNSWTFTTSTALLAYLWPAEGPSNLYSLDPATGEILQYTQGLDIQEFTASRDGITLYFSASNSQGGADLFMIDRRKAAGKADAMTLPEKLLECGSAQCRSPDLSADGKSLAYEYLIPDLKGGLAPAQIWTIDLASKVPSAVGEAGHETVLPAWSQTGWLAYYDRTSSAYVAIDPQTHATIQLPNQTGQLAAWSLDGKFLLAPEISYTQATGSHETGTSRILRYDLKTGQSEDLSGSNAVEDVDPNPSPDGKTLAFERKYLDAAHWTLGRQIWLMNADGSNSHPITSEADYNHYDLAWSRDGSMIAYVRFNQAKLSDPPELWMINVDGSSPLQLVIGGYSPVWIP